MDNRVQVGFKRHASREPGEVQSTPSYHSLNSAFDLLTQREAMKSFFVLIVCFFQLLVLPGTSVEEIKNLEIKVQLDQRTLSNLLEQLSPYYSETVIQTDTYFATNEGRLKLREEKDRTSYLIRYQRPNVEEAKESHCFFYPIGNASLFLSVLGDCLREEIKVKKQRAVYMLKPHIRVHLDQVENLGDFLEIEILLSREIPLAAAEIEMQELQERLQIGHLPKINCGYRELFLHVVSAS